MTIKPEDIPEWCLPDPSTVKFHDHTKDPRWDIPDSMEWTKIPLAPERRSKLRREMDLSQYEQMFTLFMTQVAGGVPLTTLIRDDHRCVEQGRFMRWINRDAARRAEYEAAMEAGVELLMQETVAIADNVDEDVTRSALRIKTRQQLAAKYKPRLFGDSKQIDITTRNLDRDGLKQLTASQLQELLANSQDDVIEGEYTDVGD
jgi:hypothetical protein